MRAEWNIGLRAQQDTKRNERELARNSGGGFEASMQSFCLAQLADVPQQEGSQARYQEQGMQAHLSARATNLKTHSSHYRLGVSKTLFVCMRCAYIATISSARYAFSLGECASSSGSWALARASLTALGVEP